MKNISNPLVSVILPFRNAEKFLARAIESILSQSYINLELILVDNSSEDKSPVIAKNFANKDFRIKLLTEEKVGVVNAFKTGANSAIGTFIARMDADDFAENSRLEKQIKFLLQNESIDVVASCVKYIPHADNTEGFARYVDWSNSIKTDKEIYLNRFVEFPVVNPSLLWRREVGEQFGYYKEGSFPEDYEMFLRWISNGVKFHKLSSALLHWYDSENRLTRKEKIYSEESFYKIKTQYLAEWLRAKNPNHPKVYVWGGSKISRKRAELLKNFKIEIESFIDIKETRQIQSKIISYKNIPSATICFVLVYLGEQKARLKTRNYLINKGFSEGENFLMVS